MSQADLHCDLCPAISRLFCFCKKVKTKLCKACEPVHYKKQPKAKHQTFPIGAYLFVEQPQDYDAYLERHKIVKQLIAAIDNAELRLGEECERVSQELDSEESRIIQVVKDTLESSRGELTDLYTATVATLHTLKTKVRNTLRARVLNQKDSVHRLVHDPSGIWPCLGSFNLYSHFKPDSLLKVLEDYSHCTATSDLQFDNILGDHLFWTDSDNIPRLLALNSSQRTVGIFNPQTQSFCQHILDNEVPLYEYSAWCLTEDSQLAVCGGYNELYFLI